MLVVYDQTILVWQVLSLFLPHYNQEEKEYQEQAGFKPGSIGLLVTIP